MPEHKFSILSLVIIRRHQHSTEYNGSPPNHVGARRFDRVAKTYPPHTMLGHGPTDNKVTAFTDPDPAPGNRL